MSVTNAAPALRVATIIATFKIVILIAILGIAVLGFMLGVFSGEGSMMVSGFLFLVVGVIGAAVYYVMFGWFEHTLRLLVSIAENTSSVPTVPTMGYGGN